MWFAYLFRWQPTAVLRRVASMQSGLFAGVAGANSLKGCAMLRFENKKRLGLFAVLLLAALGPLGLSGCERKERVVDIEAPGVDIEVDRNVDTGAVEVEATDKD
jgi:hypothetical protein